MSSPGLLTPQEYERRKQFLESLKSLSKPEYIEIVRILQKHNAEYSENLNGVFFNVVALTQTTFDALELFIKFTNSNKHNLLEREQLMSTLVVQQNAFL
jgi:hypothetical protein